VLLFKYVVEERMGTIILSALVAHTAWHWASDRYTVLKGFPIPELSLTDMATILRLLMVVIAAGGVMWLLSNLLSRAPGRAVAPSVPRADDHATR